MICYILNRPILLKHIIMKYYLLFIIYHICIRDMVRIWYTYYCDVEFSNIMHMLIFVNSRFHIQVMNSTSTKTSTYTLLVLLFLAVCVADNVNETSNNTDLIRDGVLVEDIAALVQRENTVSFQGLDDLIKAIDRMKTIEAEVAYLKRKAKEFAKNLLRFESYKVSFPSN